mmetsp:Transcript_1601/g.3659  ORF Transcript_1601/g.3659 Transcript_1601/m.3659 type:complete len:267 (+) Transcript_1601:814-1614(+)
MAALSEWREGHGRSRRRRGLAPVRRGGRRGGRRGRRRLQLRGGRVAAPRVARGVRRGTLGSDPAGGGQGAACRDVGRAAERTARASGGCARGSLVHPCDGGGIGGERRAPGGARRRRRLQRHAAAAAADPDAPSRAAARASHAAGARGDQKGGADAEGRAAPVLDADRALHALRHHPRLQAAARTPQLLDAAARPQRREPRAAVGAVLGLLRARHAPAAAAAAPSVRAQAAVQRAGRRDARGARARRRAPPEVRSARRDAAGRAAI